MEAVKGLKDINEMSEQELRAEVTRLRALLEEKNNTPQTSESIKDEVRGIDSSLIDSMNLSHLNETQKAILSKIMQKDPKAVEKVTDEAVFLKTSLGNYEIPLKNSEIEHADYMAYEGKNNKLFIHSAVDSYFRNRSKLEPLSRKDIQSLIDLIPEEADDDHISRPGRGDLLKLMGLSKDDLEGNMYRNGHLHDEGESVGVYLGDRDQVSHGFSVTTFNGDQGNNIGYTPLYQGILRIIKKRKQAT